MSKDKNNIIDEIYTPNSIDKLIHEPARLNIMTRLYVVESADFLFVMRQTGLTFGNLSAHMSKLEEAGYIDIIKEFVGKKPHTMLKLTEKGKLIKKVDKSGKLYHIPNLQSYSLQSNQIKKTQALVYSEDYNGKIYKRIRSVKKGPGNNTIKSET